MQPDSQTRKLAACEPLCNAFAEPGSQSAMNSPEKSALGDINGGVLVVSQFTLYGDARRGKRPSFDAAAPPEQARELYAFLVQRIQDAGLPCHTGRFQQTMQVELVNEGPVTILLDSSKAF